MNEYKLTLFYFSDESIIYSKICSSDIEAVQWSRNFIKYVLSIPCDRDFDSYKLEKITKEDLTSLAK